MAINLNIEWIFRLLLSMFLGGLIGYERKNRSKEAGVRTHAIVAVAATLMMLISKYGFADAVRFDAARIAASIVTGVGFLGAGIIYVRHDTILGLTTAAGIWATSGIGMAVGAGMYLEGCVTAVLVYVLQTVFHSAVFNRARVFTTIIVETDFTDEAANIVAAEIRKLGYVITDMELSGDEACCRLTLNLSTMKEIEIETLFSSVRKLPDVRDVYFKNSGKRG